MMKNNWAFAFALTTFGAMVFLMLVASVMIHGIPIFSAASTYIVVVFTVIGAGIAYSALSTWRHEKRADIASSIVDQVAEATAAVIMEAQFYRAQLRGSKVLTIIEKCVQDYESSGLMRPDRVPEIRNIYNETLEQNFRGGLLPAMRRLEPLKAKAYATLPRGLYDIVVLTMDNARSC